ncbi:hypothetical protein ACH427_04000 [Streptomyces sp. NPDC020379]|uniref:hypothetical protein n=1 Tax=Streptomyces sp. NPDC020379 TaxID=3365071 RepID=UPI0037B18971
MADQEASNVVALHQHEAWTEEAETAPEVIVEWHPAALADPGAYRRLLEHLFLPGSRPDEEIAA